MNRLLFVDDDIEILDINKNFFTRRGYQVDTAPSADAAIHLLSSYNYQCIILDIRMEYTDGLTLCKLLKQNYSIPIIFLTNLTEEEYLIEAFERGADDFLTKPFSLNELEQRIKVRMKPYLTQPKSASDKLVLSSTEKQAYINGQSLQLTSNEFEILEFLYNHKGTAYRQEEIYNALWGEIFYNTHTIQVQIMRIRKKFEALAPDTDYIKTQWGKGYFYTE